MRTSARPPPQVARAVSFSRPMRTSLGRARFPCAGASDTFGTNPLDWLSASWPRNTKPHCVTSDGASELQELRGQDRNGTAYRPLVRGGHRPDAWDIRSGRFRPGPPATARGVITVRTRRDLADRLTLKVRGRTERVFEPRSRWGVSLQPSASEREGDGTRRRSAWVLTAAEGRTVPGPSSGRRVSNVGRHSICACSACYLPITRPSPRTDPRGAL
jgi:hypothetical protein